MKTLGAEFVRLQEFSICDLIGAVGVYVIWDGKARARPSYIGEGVILERFSKHAGRFPWPFDGYVAITGTKDSGEAKRDAMVLEAVLLSVSHDTDRFPNHNESFGKTTHVVKILRSHNLLRIRVTGLDPLIAPGQAQKLSNAKVARIRYENGASGFSMGRDQALRSGSRSPS